MLYSNKEISSEEDKEKTLYEHRHYLFIALMKSHNKLAWRANNHSDGTHCTGYFIAGINLPTGQITYHIPIDYWELLDYSNIDTSLRAPKWDNHTSNVVLARLSKWIKQNLSNNNQLFKIMGNN